MAEETDGIDEALAGQIRVVVTAAGLIGEGIARGREQQLRRAQAASEQEARALQSRLTAERTAARAELASVQRPEWWGRATPEQIGRAYEVARAWSRDEPEAGRAEQRITEEVRTRYGVDVANAGAEPGAVRAAVARAEEDRARGTGERAAAGSDLAEAQVLLTQAGQLDRRAEEARQAAEHEADPNERAEASAQAAGHEVAGERARGAGEALYDSAERRDATARELESRGLGGDVVAAKMYADVSQAKPATEAGTEVGAGRSTKAPKTRGRTAQVQRAGVER